MAQALNVHTAVEKVFNNYERNKQLINLSDNTRYQVELAFNKIAGELSDNNEIYDFLADLTNLRNNLRATIVNLASWSTTQDFRGALVIYQRPGSPMRTSDWYSKAHEVHFNLVHIFQQIQNELSAKFVMDAQIIVRFMIDCIDAIIAQEEQFINTILKWAGIAVVACLGVCIFGAAAFEAHKRTVKK